MLSPPSRPRRKVSCPKPNGPLKLFEHLDSAVGKDLGDDHPQGVGPHVDGGHGLGRHRVGRRGESDWAPSPHCFHQEPVVKSV